MHRVVPARAAGLGWASSSTRPRSPRCSGRSWPPTPQFWRRPGILSRRCGPGWRRTASTAGWSTPGSGAQSSGRHARASSTLPRPTGLLTLRAMANSAACQRPAPGESPGDRRSPPSGRSRRQPLQLTPPPSPACESSSGRVAAQRTSLPVRCNSSSPRARCVRSARPSRSQPTRLPPKQPTRPRATCPSTPTASRPLSRARACPAVPPARLVRPRRPSSRSAALLSSAEHSAPRPARQPAARSGARR